MRASWRSCRPTPQQWAGPSCAAAWPRNSGPTGRRSSPASTRRRRSPPRWARSIARRCSQIIQWVGARWRRSSSIPTCPRPWKPTSTSSSSCSRSASASIRRSEPTRSMPRSPTGCARNSTTAGRPGTRPSTATCCATRGRSMVPASSPPIRPSVCSPWTGCRASLCSTGRRALRRSAMLWPSPCSAPGTCRSTSMASSMAIRISATILCGRTVR